MSKVIKKTISILTALKPTEEKSEWGASELSEKLDMPVQTTHRLLMSLSRHGFVYRDDKTKSFKLGLALMEFGLTIRDNLSVRNKALPIMRSLSEQTKESIYLTIPEGTDGIFIECIDSPHLLKLVEPVGMRRPLHIGASKKAILAFYEKNKQEMILNSLRSKNLIDSDISEIKDNLMSIKKQRFSVSFGETSVGTTSVASPIFSWESEVIASISIAGPDVRLPKTRINEMVYLVKKAAHQISEEMGWMNY